MLMGFVRFGAVKCLDHNVSLNPLIHCSVMILLH